MNDDQKVRDEAEEIRAETAAEAPELAEADRLTELEKELEEVRQHVLYAQAETQNVRRRLEQEKQSATAYAITGFARDLLSVKDNLDRALQAVPDELLQDEKFKGLITGVEVTARELDAVFQRNGIVRVEAMGQPLDPNKHQAMIEVPSDAEPGTIVQEMQPGYTIKDRLLRPALVGVARKG
ncbi:nucleotide exchange factor GrpE [Sphingomonas sp. LY54]|uniref:nucleotide exchange factor GrpE n=1 Tax=Sphingomonadales TaxID=204457 RepID=UPI002ADEF010|nr:MULTISPECIES: nucleotide exchange factor GrpE [Sphingomonadales]MEA1013776.1 nucleotide exchange factor GrpE [Sphingosinicella sp. LY1275]WRP29178.1 nucleotide exchange factor GrpE [Sphingomonas sp. LY54]